MTAMTGSGVGSKVGAQSRSLTGVAGMRFLGAIAANLQALHQQEARVMRQS